MFTSLLLIIIAVYLEIICELREIIMQVISTMNYNYFQYLYQFAVRCRRREEVLS